MSAPSARDTSPATLYTDDGASEGVPLSQIKRGSQSSTRPKPEPIRVIAHQRIPRSIQYTDDQGTVQTVHLKDPKATVYHSRNTALSLVAATPRGKVTQRWQDVPWHHKIGYFPSKEDSHQLRTHTSVLSPEEQRALQDAGTEDEDGSSVAGHIPHPSEGQHWEVKALTDLRICDLGWEKQFDQFVDHDPYRLDPTDRTSLHVRERSIQHAEGVLNDGEAPSVGGSYSEIPYSLTPDTSAALPCIMPGRNTLPLGSMVTFDEKGYTIKPY